MVALACFLTYEDISSSLPSVIFTIFLLSLFTLVIALRLVLNL